MGIIERFICRKDKEKMSLQRATSVKHGIKNSSRNSKLRRNVSTRLVSLSHISSSRQAMPSSAKKSLVGSEGGVDTFTLQTSGKISVSGATASIILREVSDLLRSSSSESCTVLAMAYALAQSNACRDSHAKGTEDGVQALVAALKGRGLAQQKLRHIAFWGRRDQQEKESMKRRYDWTRALNRLEQKPSSRDKVISSLEEAKESLEEVLNFNTEEEEVDSQNIDLQSIGGTASSTISPDPIAAKHAKSLEAEMERIQASVDRLTFASKWRQIASIAEQLGKDITDEDLKSLVEVDKADLRFNARIRDAREFDEALRQKEAAKKLAERLKLAEARKRASSLMRPLNDEERQIVREAVYGSGSNDEVITKCDTDSVLRKSIRTLQPGQWLNDEIIHYFYLMLAKRDEEKCEKDPSKKRSHFFKSFFITKLLNEGNAACDGQYEYRNVKRWSKNVPGKDIFGLDKIFFPINMGNMHWVCAVIFMTEKRIQFYDSMGSSGEIYLEALFQYLQDEHMDKKKKPLPDLGTWELKRTESNTPRQRNGFDCGVFTCMFADFLSKDTALVFDQDHINQCRERIALSIMNGKAIM